MPQTPTTNRGLPAPALADTADGPDALDDLRQALDNVAGIGWGTIALRPAATGTVGTAIGCPGTFYWATDTSQLSLSVAAQWIDLAGASGAPIPIGASLEYAGSADPSDSRFLLEDGRELLRAGTYAPLYTVIGNTYGAGNGTTTFNIPDSRGRVTVGPDNMGTARGAAGRLDALSGLGNVGGEQKHLLTSGESGMVAHNHGGSSGAMSANSVHGHSITAANSGGAPPNALGPATGFQFSGAGGSTYGIMTTLAGSFAWTLNADNVNIDHTHTIGTQAAASAASAHNTMQPYVVKNKIIRVR